MRDYNGRKKLPLFLVYPQPYGFITPSATLLLVHEIVFVQPLNILLPGFDSPSKVIISYD